MEVARKWTIPTDVALDLLNQSALWGEEQSRQLQLEIYNRRHPQPTICQHILEGLFKLDPPSALQLAIKNHRHEIRLKAAQLVGEAGDEKWLPYIAPLLHDKAALSVVPAIKQAYPACRTQSPEIVAPFLELFKTDTETLYADLQLLQYPHTSEAILTALLQVFDREHDDVETAQLYVRNALKFYGDQTRLVQEVRARLSNPALELGALFLLRDIGTADDVRPYLDHPNPQFYRPAVQGLIRHDLPEDRPRLKALRERLLAAGALQ